MGFPVLGRVAGLAAGQSDDQIAAAGQAFRSAGSGPRPGTDKRAPADSETDGCDQQQANNQQNLSEFFHPSPERRSCETQTSKTLAWNFWNLVLIAAAVLELAEFAVSRWKAVFHAVLHRFQGAHRGEQRLPSVSSCLCFSYLGQQALSLRSWPSRAFAEQRPSQLPLWLEPGPLARRPGPFPSSCLQPQR